MPTNEGHSQKWEIVAPYLDTSTTEVQPYRLTSSSWTQCVANGYVTAAAGTPCEHIKAMPNSLRDHSTYSLGLFGRLVAIAWDDIGLFVRGQGMCSMVEAGLWCFA